MGKATHEMTVVPAAVDPRRCNMGVLGSVTITAGALEVIEIAAHDRFGNPLLEGGDTFVLEWSTYRSATDLRMGATSMPKASCEVGQGRCYEATVNATRADNYLIKACCSATHPRLSRVVSAQASVLF